MGAPRFAYIWTYRVRRERRDEFLAAYRPGGAWTQLFATDPAWLGTTLLASADDDLEFATIDYWTSRAARDSFRERHAAEFQSIDRRCAEFTDEETYVGDFDETGAG